LLNRYDWSGKLNVMGMATASKVNGPTETGRFVVWLQGCPLGCVGCFNPQSWNGTRVMALWDPEELAEHILASGTDGLTISGGEPLMQAGPLLKMLRALHTSGEQVDECILKPSLDHRGVIMFTGYDIDELDTEQRECLELIDLSVLGRFKQDLRTHVGLRGSSNQTLRYNDRPGRGKSLLGDAPIEMDQAVEVFPSDSDTFIVTGFPGGKARDLASLGLEIEKI
jgi:anaerobic ribonucleoside-triphosphate reductase activating protein